MGVVESPGVDACGRCVSQRERDTPSSLERPDRRRSDVISRTIFRSPLVVTRRSLFVELAGRAAKQQSTFGRMQETHMQSEFDAHTRTRRVRACVRARTYVRTYTCIHAIVCIAGDFRECVVAFFFFLLLSLPSGLPPAIHFKVARPGGNSASRTTRRVIRHVIMT